MRTLAELGDIAIHTNEARRVLGQRCIHLQAAVIFVNVELMLLTLAVATRASAWWLVNGLCLVNCGLGLLALRTHYAEYLQHRAAVVDAETEMDVVVTSRRLQFTDAMIGGGLLVGVAAMYSLHIIYRLVK
jgi:hypothetical protein